MVEKHIRTLLYDHDCVIIPDFGGLIARYASARINPAKHTFSPPSKKIAFNEKLTLNDGLLISTIAHHKDISKEEAQQLVTDFVHQARYKLDAEQRFELQHIGIFRYNAERHLEFEYVEGDNLLEESFGLPEVMARPIRTEEPAVLRTLIKEREPVQENVKQPFRKKIWRLSRVAAGLAVGGIAVSALYFLSQQPDYNLSSLNPISSFTGHYTPGNTNFAVRYTSDYVPVSADERQAAYAAILNVAAPTTSDNTPEAWTSVREMATTPTIALADTVETAINEQISAAPPVVEEVVEEKQPELTVSERTGRYYVIVGGYSRFENARTGRDAISKREEQAKVLLPEQGSKWYRVSVADYDNPAEAQAALMNYRKKYGETLWVLNY
ncbi:SPOR domain-containing protein [Pontibacter sp. 172403-2]|uniref:HU domain-containing protein n=1 Tax=Pontibacter rufus TaxID=2791028 RepID=UPI0018AFE42D|nr:SPOR domain-containing protein [Pontibacter sp. 172403-2]MBF9253664.1 SPOR domain-containing protein [Pontibacter sp. 172403-2]